jgi:hypothetical protein
MKEKAIILLLLCFGRLFAQNKVYIKPIFENTSYISHNSKHKIITPEFEYGIMPIIIHSGVDIGIAVGCSFGSGKYTLEVGIQQSMAGSGIYFKPIYYRTYIYNSKRYAYYSTSLADAALATAGTKIPIRFSYRLFNKPIHVYKPTAFSISGYTIGALHYYHQFIGDNTQIILNRTFMTSPVHKTNITASANWLKSRTAMLEVGMGFEFCKRKREWLSLSITYLRGFKNLMVNRVRITVSDTVSGINQTYSDNVYGNGTALIVSLSKKIFISPKCKKSSK